MNHVFTTSYRPHLNSSTERVHHFLNSAIGIYCENFHELWEEFLQPPVYVDHTAPISSTHNIGSFS